MLNNNENPWALLSDSVDKELNLYYLLRITLTNSAQS